MDKKKDLGKQYENSMGKGNQNFEENVKANRNYETKGTIHEDPPPPPPKEKK